MVVLTIFYSKILSIFKNYVIINYIIGKVKGGDRMQILKVMITDPGFPPEECTYAKVDENTNYYFIKDYHLENENIIATTNYKEAIGHEAYTSIGVINKEGDILIPFENKTIKPIKDKLLLVERNVPMTECVLNALKEKTDPFAAQTHAQNAATIKKQMKDIMGISGDFIFDNQFSEAAIYTMDGVNVAGNYFSFIGENNGDYYLATNVVGATIMKFNPSQLVQSQTNTTSESSGQQPQIPQTPIIDNSQTSDTVSGGANNSLTSNIDIPNQNMTEEEKPPIVNTTEDSGGSAIVSENTVNLESNNIPTTNKSEVMLNIPEDVPQQSGEGNNQDSVIEDSSSDDIDLDISEEIDNLKNEDNSEEVQFDDRKDTDEVQETAVESKSQEPYSLTDEDITAPVIADATNTIKNLFASNRYKDGVIDKLMGEIEALKSNVAILREESFSKEQEVQSLRHKMNDYRTKSIDLERANAQLNGTLSRQSNIMQSLEEQNTALRHQVAGLHALSNAVAEAGVLIQPVEDDESLDKNDNQNTDLNIDNYLNGEYKNNIRDMSSYLTRKNQKTGSDINEGGQTYQKTKAA